MATSYDEDGFDGAGWDMDQYDPYYDDPIGNDETEELW